MVGCQVRPHVVGAGDAADVDAREQHVVVRAGERPGLRAHRPTACTTRRGPRRALEALDPLEPVGPTCVRCAPSVPMSSPPGASTAQSRSGPLRELGPAVVPRQSTRPSAPSAASPNTRVGPGTVTPFGRLDETFDGPDPQPAHDVRNPASVSAQAAGSERYGALNAMRSTRSPYRWVIISAISLGAPHTANVSASRRRSGPP